MMLGAITGDIVGSVFEFDNVKDEAFPLFSEKSRFTDDSVLTCAVADALLSASSYKDKLKEYFLLYPKAGFGASFMRWGFSKEPKPYNSYGNGSAMRVSPVAYVFNDLELVLSEAKKSAEVTHNHTEGIKGAQAVAGSIFLARNGKTKEEIKSFFQERFGYMLDFDLVKLRKNYQYDITCQGTVPQAIFCFLISNDFEDAIRKAVSIGGDSDTVACITGSIAEAYYKGIPEAIKSEVLARLDDRLRDVVKKFSQLKMVTT